MTETIPNPIIKFTVPYEGRHFLTIKNAREVSSQYISTFNRKVFEIDTPAGTEVWIERESMLEAPLYWYQLFQYQGEE